MRKCLLPLAAAAFVGLPTVLGAATVTAIPFSAPTDYTNNFRNTMLTDATIGQVSVNGSGGQSGLLRDSRNANADSNDATAISLYDTTPADGGTKNTFLNETIQSDFQIATASDSFGLFARVNNAETNGYLAVVTLNSSGNNDRIRIWTNVSPSLGLVGGNTTLVSVTTTSDAIAASTFYTLSFNATTVGANVQLTANVYAITDPSHSTPLMTATFTDTNSTLTATGEAGVYLDVFTTTIGHTADADNFAVVPEPGSLAVMLLASTGLLGRRRFRF